MATGGNGVRMQWNYTGDTLVCPRHRLGGQPALAQARP